MDEDKPKNIDEYMEWLEKEHNVEVSTRTIGRYEAVTRKIKLDFEDSDFWIQLVKELREFDSEYRMEYKYPLLLSFEPEVCIKPFNSFLLKTYRKNVLDNNNWPNEPEVGWILPKNWYSRINDIIRTLLTVKYLDGVEFMIDKIKSLCEQHKLELCVFLEATEVGYYAAHLYIEREFEIPRVTWDTERKKISIEVQITTQLQEIIRRLLHKYYEERRKELRKEDVKWQWNYQSDEFAANYLGHILHYIEGMIMDIREK